MFYRSDGDALLSPKLRQLFQTKMAVEPVPEEIARLRTADDQKRQSQRMMAHIIAIDWEGPI